MTSPLRRPRTRRHAFVGGVALLALTGCSNLHPGDAATVGSTSISRDQVNTLARIQCDLAENQSQDPSKSQPRAALVQGTVNVLVQTAIDNMYGKSVGASFDNSVLQGQIQQFKSGVSGVPRTDQDTLVQAFTDYTRGQLLLADVGAKKLQEQGQQNPDTNAAITEGNKLAESWAKRLHVTIDPRYNPGRSDQAGGGDGSISRVASSYAKSAAGTPTPTFVAGLPAALRCG
ncbi:MAG: hypothetical protein ACR2FG_09085 [Marmoricola sp.]